MVVGSVHEPKTDRGVNRKGILFVMTGASGVGKDTIRQAALADVDNLFFSISATTRTKRPGETHGKQYFFHDRRHFETMVANEGLLEYADYVGDYYGTPAQPVLDALEKGRDVLLELELVGARQVKERLKDAVMIFIAPPTLVELERRLRGRGTDSEEKVQKRLARAREEIKAIPEFDYVVVNDDLDRAYARIEAILQAEWSRVRRIRDLQDHARQLRGDLEALIRE